MLNLTVWLETNLYRFRLSNQESLDLFSIAKPLGELCLVLIGIKNRRPANLIWADELIQDLWLDLVHIDTSPYWYRLWEKINSQDVYGEILQLFLHLEMLYGRRFSFHKQIKDYLGQVMSRTEISLSLRYTCELAGEGSCEAFAIQEIQEILSKHEKSISLFSSDLYDLTHAIFYGSRMGARLMNWKGYFPKLPELVDYYLHDSVERDDLDLAAELLVSLILLKAPQTNVAQSTYQRLKENIQPDLLSPLIVGNLFHKKGDQFDSQYHLALVTLLSLHTFNTQSHVS